MTTSLSIIVLNYRRAELTIDCLHSLANEVAGHEERGVIVIDNGSGDGSADAIRKAIADHGWGGWVRFIASPVNRGFAGGNNLGIEAQRADAYILLNSDARATRGAIDALEASLDRNPDAGLIGPRLIGPKGDKQVSCFRFRTPMSELLAAAGTGVLDRMFHPFVVAGGVPDVPSEVPWVSFACVMIRHRVVEQIGMMDEDYFMYFEDIDYSRRARRGGWSIMHDPSALIIHLRGGSSSVKSALKERRRVPRYYYESRSRYFAKFYGGTPGLVVTNAFWQTGRLIAIVREKLGSKKPHYCDHESRDNWTNWLRPLQRPVFPGGGEL